MRRRHNIRRLSLFGSVPAGEYRSDGDVDLLVEFDPGKAPGLLGIAGIEAEISDLLGGRRVDLRTARDFIPHFRNEVIQRAEEQYAAQVTQE